MPQIIDTLYGVEGAAPGPWNTFVPNNLLRKVAIDVVTAPAWSYVLGVQAAGAKAFKFTIRDSFRLLSYGLILPHGFQFANEGNLTLPDGACTIRLKGNSNLAADYFLDQVSYLMVPFANYETATDIYVDWLANAPTVAAGATYYTLEMRVESGEVSMVGANGMLNGINMYPIPFVKILHNLPLST